MMAFDSWYLFFAILLITLSTVVGRALFYWIGDYVHLPKRVRNALKYAPVTALSALIIPSIAPWTETGPVLDMKIFAVALAAAVFLWRPNFILFIVSGMVFLWSLNYLFLN